jgi:hypothetical protein
MAYDISLDYDVDATPEEVVRGRADTGTHLHFAESGFATQPQRDDFARAWPYVFGQLADCGVT